MLAQLDAVVYGLFLIMYISYKLNYGAQEAAATVIAPVVDAIIIKALEADITIQCKSIQYPDVNTQCAQPVPVIAVDWSASDVLGVLVMSPVII